MNLKFYLNFTTKINLKLSLPKYQTMRIGVMMVLNSLEILDDT